MECPKCKKENYRRNGKRKDGEQRYFCKNCKKTYSKHKTTYNRTEQRLLSMLINFLENDFDSLDLKGHLEKSKKYIPGISKIELSTYRETKPYGCRTEYEVKCRNPRLLICGNKTGINVIKIPKGLAKKCKKSFNFVID